MRSNVGTPVRVALAVPALAAAIGLAWGPDETRGGLTRATPVLTAAPAATSRATLGRAPQAVELDRLAGALLEAGRLPSLSIAIARDGEIVYARAFGYADIGRRTPATTDTRYRCASVSKLLTATALGRLVQQERIDLDAPVTRYVENWPAEPQVTARQLAGHLSGVAHYRNEDTIDRARHYGSVTEALAGFVDSPRAGAPGEAYVYSTHGYTLLSAAIEGAAGAPFLDVLRTEVFDPLGMSSSGPDLRASPHESMSTLYVRSGLDPAPIERPEDPSYKWAGGGLVSTPSDLVRLADSYMNGFLSPDVVEEMWVSQSVSSGEETGVGVAWRIGTDPAGRRVLHHSGSMGGARTTLALYPDRREAIAVMTNMTWPMDIHSTAMWLMEAVREAESGTSPESPIETGGERAYSGAFGDSEAAGTLSFGLEEGWSGWITPPDPFAEWSDDLVVDRMPFHHVRGTTYLLVTPWGLYPVEVAGDGGVVRGEGRFGSNVWTFESSPGAPAPDA